MKSPFATDEASVNRAFETLPRLKSQVERDVEQLWSEMQAASAAFTDDVVAQFEQLLAHRDAFMGERAAQCRFIFRTIERMRVDEVARRALKHPAERNTTC